MSARPLLLAKGADESAASREAALESAISAGSAARKRPRAAPERSALATWIDDGEALVAGLAADGAITDVDLRDFRRSMERVRSLTTGWRSRSRKVWGDAGVSTACLEFCSPECLAALRGASSAFRAMAMRECLWRLHADRQPICVALKQGLWRCSNSPYREYVRVAKHLVSPRFRDQKFLCTPPRRDAEFVLVYAVALAGGGAPVTGVCDVSTSPSGRLFAMWRRGRHPELDDRPTAAFDGARASVSLLRKAPERKILCLGHGLVADGAGAARRDDDVGFVRFRAGGGDSRALRVTSFLIKRKLRYEMSDSEDDEYVGEQPTSADVDVELAFHAPDDDDGPPRDTHGATHGFVVRLLDNNGYSVRQNLGILDGLGDNAWV